MTTPKNNPAPSTRKTKAYGYVVEELVFDFNDDYYSSYRDDASQLATHRVYMNKADADNFCAEQNRGQVDLVLASPEAWAGYEGPFGQRLANFALPGQGFRKVCDILLPKKAYPDLDRDDSESCTKLLDEACRFDMELTDKQRDVLVKNGPDFFNVFRVSKVEIV